MDEVDKYAVGQAVERVAVLAVGEEERHGEQHQYRG
tara:strand:+ start:270 stop:377 length:108 start_codon:yes stop_codon:yes gene_type:complete